MKTENIMHLTVPIAGDLQEWLWQEGKRLNISREALIRAILIDAMLDARDKPAARAVGL